MIWDQLKPGVLYRVTFEDCCVSGEFTARFIRNNNDEDLIFDKASLSNWNCCTFKAVE